MEGSSTIYTVAIWRVPRPFRLIALCATSLLLIPQSSAQDLPITYSGKWADVYLSIGLSHYASFSSNARASFSVNADVYDTIDITAGSLTPVGLGAAGLYDGNGKFLDNINAAFRYNIPNEKRGVQQYSIRKEDGVNTLALYVDSVTPGIKAQTSNTQLPTVAVPQPNATVSNLTSLPITVSSLSSTTPATSLSSASSTSETSPPLGQITAYPTGLDSPPPNTNTASSISGASFASDSSNSGPSSSTIVGAVFGVLIGLTLCIFAALFYRRRRIRQRVAPSTAFMNYRSTTEQPPTYPFSRTSFFRRSVPGLGTSDSKMSSPRRYAPGIGGLGYGATATAGAGGRKLMTLDEKSAEGAESIQTTSAIAPSYEDPRQLFVPLPGHGGMGLGAAVGTTVAVGGIYGPGPASRGRSIDGGVARTLTPPPSSTSSKFASTPSLMDQNPYDGMVEPIPELPNNPFKTPPAEGNMAGRGAWGRA